jgi:hypothetical protein
MKIRRFKKLVTSRIDLVDRGACLDPVSGDGAHILIAKRDNGEPPAPTLQPEFVAAIGKAVAEVFARGIAAPISKSTQENPPMSETVTISKCQDDIINKAILRPGQQEPGSFDQRNTVSTLLDELFAATSKAVLLADPLDEKVKQLAEARVASGQSATYVQGVADVMAAQPILRKARHQAQGARLRGGAA